MTTHKLLIANRGEIAIRIARSAYELGWTSVTIFSEDDATSLHTRRSDESYPLSGKGTAPYLDIDQIIQIAKKSGCQYIHPGYGFLSENVTFAQRCADENLIFVGPKPETLALLGNKIKARQTAKSQAIPIIDGTLNPTTLEEAIAFFKTLKIGEKMMIKALAGGGGRGMRIVEKLEEIETAFRRCQSEAQKYFGQSDVYVEKMMAKARHIEVQIMGDGTGAVSHLWERECSIQRRHQKLIEIAPCPDISTGLRKNIIEAALKITKAVNYANAGTVEFLVDISNDLNALEAETPFYFIEINPRIQVEHTVSEEITGIDIVKFQLEQATGKTLKDLKLNQENIPAPQGFAIQARINMESINEVGEPMPQMGVLTQFDLPFGAGIRVETLGYSTYKNSPRFDSLLAKVICHHSDDFSILIKKLQRSLSEFKIAGIQTNLLFIKNILKHPDFLKQKIYTRFVDDKVLELVKSNNKKVADKENISTIEEKVADIRKISANVPEGTTAVLSSMLGSVVSIEIQVGDQIRKGQTLLILEAMKMENVLESTVHGVVQGICIKVGDVVEEKQVLLFIKEQEQTHFDDKNKQDLDLDKIRPELAELQERQAFLLDENRSQRVQKRHQKGKSTARENIAALCEKDSFIEYGSMIVAAQRSRRKLDDLIKNTPADGIITGIGEINATDFGSEQAKCMILCYDYMVLAGTQGMFGHQKTDRVLEIAERAKLPVVLFAEGGGGRPGDTDFQGIGGLHITTFAHYARLSGLVPRIAVVSGYCFAGNAALAGCSDLIIATEDTSIGMGGPAMIEGGGLGAYHPRTIGPVSVQAPNGVIDVVVKNEIEAVEVTKKCLSYFQGDTQHWKTSDQRLLRHLIPENRRRVYDIRKVIAALADQESVLELRPTYAIGMITAFIRIEGKAMGLIANNPKYLGGAIDAEGSGKAARFIQLCNAFNIPMLSLCDTPGFMVGPEAEKTALVRHTSRLFTAAAAIKVPFFTVVLRKAYGLGSMAMAAGGFHQPFFTVSWPTGEFGGMGLEGAVRLGYRKELEAIEDLAVREAAFQKMVAAAYQHGKAINTASYLEIDEVIDPKDTRKWIVNGLKANPKWKSAGEGRRGFVDTW